MRNINTVGFRSVIFLLMSLVLVILISGNSTAIGISVTKAVIDYNNILRGGYAEDVLYVSTDASFDIPLSYEVMGDISDWITVEPNLNDPNNTVFVSNSKYQTVKIIVQPPADIPLGQYSGNVRILTGTLATTGGQYGSQLQAAFMIRINVQVTGTEFLSCSGGSIQIKDTEIGSPIEYYMGVTNSGNIRVTPSATIDIWNQDQTRIVKTRKIDFNNKFVLPTTTETFYNSFPADLRIGQYWAHVTVAPCGNTELVTFNVYEKGALLDKGDLIRIDNKAWAKVGEIVPITASFKNSGVRTVSAKFKGVITSENKIIDTIDSEFYDVPSGETANMQVFFTPKKQGQYIITGRVLYNNKLTFEKSSVLNVNEGEDITGFDITYVVIIIIIIIIILLLLIRIKKKRSRIHRM